LFWRAYAGPCLDEEPAEQKAPALRSIFRKWLFHLDGDWVQELTSCKEAGERSEFGADYKQLLDDARFLAAGLMPCDDDESSLQQFVFLISGILATYNPLQLDERSAAEAAVSQVERRRDIFTTAQIGEVSLAYEQSVERAVLDQALEEQPEVGQDIFFDPALEESEPGSEHGLGGAPFTLPLLTPSVMQPAQGILQHANVSPVAESFWAQGAGGDLQTGDGSTPSPEAMESFWREAGAGDLFPFGQEPGPIGDIFSEDAQPQPALGQSQLGEGVSFWRGVH